MREVIVAGQQRDVIVKQSVLHVMDDSTPVIFSSGAGRDGRLPHTRQKTVCVNMQFHLSRTKLIHCFPFYINYLLISFIFFCSLLLTQG